MKNWYWNRDNFESLAWLAGRLCTVPELARLAGYCRLREKGLRKKALAEVREFLTETAALSEERRLALSPHLLELRSAAPGAHQFLAQPVIESLSSLRCGVRPNPATKPSGSLPCFSAGRMICGLFYSMIRRTSAFANGSRICYSDTRIMKIFFTQPCSGSPLRIRRLRGGEKNNRLQQSRYPDSENRGRSRWGRRRRMDIALPIQERYSARRTVMAQPHTAAVTNSSRNLSLY